MAPELGAAGRIEAHDAVAGEHDHLLASLHGDEDRRGRGDGEVSAAPRDAPVVLVERHDRLPGAARRRDDQIPVGQQAATVAGLARHDAVVRRRPEVADQVVRPEHLPRRLVQREELLVGAGGEQALADDQRRGVRPDAERDVEAVERRRIPLLPERAAGGRVERHDDLLLAPGVRLAAVRRAVLGEQAAAIDEDARMPAAQRAAPEPRWPSLRPGAGEPHGVAREVAPRPAPARPLGRRRRRRLGGPGRGGEAGAREHGGEAGDGGHRGKAENELHAKGARPPRTLDEPARQSWPAAAIGGQPILPCPRRATAQHPAPRPRGLPAARPPHRR
jgi:hypothetical protein